MQNEKRIKLALLQLLYRACELSQVHHRGSLKVKYVEQLMQDNPFQQYEPHLSIVVEEVRSWYWVWPLPKKKRVLVLASLDIVDPRKGQILVADQSMRSIISSEIKNQIDLVNYTVVVN